MTVNNLSHLTAEQSVGDWVTADYRLAAVFEKYGIDYCCGGQNPWARPVQSTTLAPTPSYKKSPRSPKRRAVASGMTSGL